MLTDVALLWEWEHDEDFISILDRNCNHFGLNSYLIHPYNITGLVIFGNDPFMAQFFYDRASDTNPAFEPIVKYLTEIDSIPLNDPGRLQDSLDKATMHHQLIEHGLHVPYTIILSPNRDWTKIKIGELIRLGEPFIIKPAIGGGGVGVELNAKTLFDIVKAKEGKSKEKFLLQEKVLPVQFGEKRAWFRVYFVCGKVIACWWDDITHIYFRVTPEDEKIYGLQRLTDVMLRMAGITKLNFFSTEIAMVDRETFVVIDYVNDQCDMRLKSRHPDGVPDDVVEEIAFEIARYIHQTLYSQSRQLKIADAGMMAVPRA
jgi:hypothetical protein